KRKTRTLLLIGIASSALGGTIAIIVTKRPVLDAAKSAMRSLWHSATAQIALPVWLLIPIFGWALLTLYRIAREMFTTPEPPQPQIDYREDEFLGLRWRWPYPGGAIGLPIAYCLTCDTMAIWTEIRPDVIQRAEGIRPMSIIACEHCRCDLYTGEGDKPD